MSAEPVDVLIVGSGHAGGMAAKVLTEKGISCLMLNAGPVADVLRAGCLEHLAEHRRVSAELRPQRLRHVAIPART